MPRPGSCNAHDEWSYVQGTHSRLLMENSSLSQPMLNTLTNGSEGGHHSNSSGNRMTGGSGSTGALEKGESYRGRTQAWWSVDEHMKPRGVMMSSHQRMGMTLAARIFHQSEDNWDLSDSLADLYLEHDIINKKSWSSLASFKPPSNLDNIDRQKWLDADTSHGFIRVYPPDSTSVSEVSARLIPCSLAMEAHSICQAIGVPPNSLHVQFSGDIIRRLDPYEHPLVLQNEYLSKIGYQDVYRIQMEGLASELGYLIRFYSGKPFFENTMSKNHLSSRVNVRYGGVLQRWSKRLCTLTGTQLKIFKDKSESGMAQVIQLSNGAVEECHSKSHPHCLKLITAHSGPEKAITLSFEQYADYSKWFRKCKKAVMKLPSNADLSSCNLEFLPETVFINAQLNMLNLRHNALKHRPTEEDIYTIGWLDDLPRFQCMRSLNLADNGLVTFPKSLCEMASLVELNLACNKIEEVPAEIGNLHSLQALHLHNNHLSNMPTEILHLKKLVILVLAFNKFHQVPPCVAQLTDVRSSECETIIMAGNLLDSLSGDIINKLKHCKKVDFRMNNLTLPASETLHMHILDQLTHLDLRVNNVKELDLRCIKSLEYLNVERNGMHTLQLNGSALKTIFAGHNELQQFLVSPKPEWLELIDLSHNKLERLPEWIADCFFLKRLNASHNKLQCLPQRIFSEAHRLRQLIADHNEIRELPHEIANSVLEEINLHHNVISFLPEEFLSKLNKLKVLNLSSNALTDLPHLNEIEDLNKLHELYLSQNSLQDNCMDVISGCLRLKILHLAYNEITHIDDKAIGQLELLQELNVSGNRMRSLPKILMEMPELKLLRAHSNLLRTLPDLSDSSSLKHFDISQRDVTQVLDVGCNKLLSISASDLATSTSLVSLDMQMTQYSIDQVQMREARKNKLINSVDSSGENRDINSAVAGITQHKMSKVCNIGFAETNGSRNKLCISVVHQIAFEDRDEALFCMFDGGRNGEVPKILKSILPEILNDEISKSEKPSVYLKYTFLHSHKMLKNTGQNLGASALVCHIRRSAENSRHFHINLANCGDIVAVLCRAGDAVILSRTHTITEDREEASRIFRSDGIVTEDNRVNGTSFTSRVLGSCYLYPHVIPEPHVIKKTLRPEDQFLIIANSSLWRYLSHKEAIEEIQYIANPVVAAKRLQDLAQSYGCKENVSVLVIQFNCNLLSTVPSMASIVSSQESVVSVSKSPSTISDSSTASDVKPRAKKRPVPAPRLSLPRASLSSSSDGSSLTTLSLSRTSIPEEDLWVEKNMEPSEVEITLQKRISEVKELELEHALGQREEESRDHMDSSLTLTGSNNDIPEHISRLPMHSSDTRLMDFIDSTSTLYADEDTDGRLSYPKKSLHQSDSKLLHASQIELKSTNYFNRPAMSQSDLEDETDHEDYTSGPTSPPNSYISEAQYTGPRNRCNCEIVRSPDGSYFSIDEDSEEENMYENVPSLKQEPTDDGMNYHHNGNRYTPVNYQNVHMSDDTGEAHEFDTDIPHMSHNSMASDISLVGHDQTLAQQSVPTSSQHRTTYNQEHSILCKKYTQPNVQFMSNGSSAYGSGSLAETFNTYL